jgi:hypothetical protein
MTQSFTTLSRRGATLAQATPDATFSDPDLSYAPFAFWFWNGPLDSDYISGMAAEMCRQRLNPGYVHTRLHSNFPTEWWISEAWFKAFVASLAKTAEAGMHLTYTSGDPCFPQRMILEKNPEFAACSIGSISSDVAGGSSFKVPASFFAVAARLAEGKDPKSIVSSTLKIIGEGDPFLWSAPEGGTWRVYVFTKYHDQNRAGSPITFLDRRVAPVWMEVEHDKYAAHVGGYMGSTMPGIFVDHEGSYGYKLAWSDDLAREYAARTGHDTRLWMPLLMDEDTDGLWGRARWEWFDLVTRLYSECLMAPINAWCHERKMFVTCHFWEDNLVAQALQVGGLLIAQRAYSRPGTDSLFLTFYQPREFKETQSVSEFEGRQFMCEMMGVAGWHFTPDKMKHAANCAIAWGITQFVPHAINTNPANVGYPPDFFTMNPHWRYFHLWTDFSRRACYVNDHGRLAAEVLLLYPMDSVWALLGDGVFDPATPQGPSLIDQKEFPEVRHGAELVHIDQLYSAAMETMTRARVEYMIADSDYLREMNPSADGTLTKGEFAFKTLILPPLRLLPLEAAEKAVRLAQSGGHVYALGSLPDGSAEKGMNDPKMKKLMDDLRAAPGFVQAKAGLAALIGSRSPGLAPNVEFETGEFPMITTQRTVGGRSFIWLVNNEPVPQQCTVRIRGASGEATIWDCETGEKRMVASEDVADGSRLSLNFEPNEAFWLVHDPKKKAHRAKSAPASFETLHTFDDPWFLQIGGDQPPIIQTKLPAPEWLWSGREKRPLESWLKWDLKHFSGFVDYSASFEIDQVQGAEILDLGRVLHMAEVWINGENAGSRLWAPFKFQVGKFLRPGENSIRIRVGNLYLNTVAQDADYEWRWYKPPEDEALDAGLFGPVRLLRPR